MTEGSHERMLDELGTAITCEHIPAGSVLRIEELQRKFGASRTVTREVVRALEAMRLTTSKRRVGITVRDPADWNHYDPRVIRWQLGGSKRQATLRVLMELRWAVEPSAAGFAALRATPEERGRVRALATRLTQTAKVRDLTAFLDYDIAFHHTVLSASRNPMFCQLSDVIAEVLTGRTEYGLMPEEPQQEAVALHVEVASAVDAGDSDTAERAMRDIMVQARDEMAERFDQAER